VVNYYEYDSAYHGSARPVVEASISKLGKRENTFTLTALIDSGADATMIPIRVLKHIGTRQARQRRMTDASGLSYIVDIYEVVVQIGSFTVPKVYAIADRNNSEVTIGRDVLNHLIITLNGLAYTVEISQ
jgi:predicted aspartyl protease